MKKPNNPAEQLATAPCSPTPAAEAKREMTMMTWLATEGGRKCPACGKYAKAEHLGFTGGYANIGGSVVHVSSYGHLPGHGCNQLTRQAKAVCRVPERLGSGTGRGGKLNRSD